MYALKCLGQTAGHLDDDGHTTQPTPQPASPTATPRLPPRCPPPPCRRPIAGVATPPAPIFHANRCDHI